MDQKLRELERRYREGYSPDILLSYYGLMNRASRPYVCNCAQFHQQLSCELPDCSQVTSVGFICETDYLDEPCILCQTCKAADHWPFKECERCLRKGCVRHFGECENCYGTYCRDCLTGDNLHRGMRIPGGLLSPPGYVRGCADL